MDKKTYQGLLEDPRWVQRRNQILSRDHNTCQMCGTQTKRMQVHHRFYIEGRLPWEYSDDVLVTLCEDCHNLIHREGELFRLDSYYDVMMGDLYRFDHSDFTSTCIVYNVCKEYKEISFIEYDNGAAFDSIFEETVSFEYFYRRYSKIEDYDELDSEFSKWVNHILKDGLSRYPIGFQFHIKDVLLRNPRIVELIKRTDGYEF